MTRRLFGTDGIRARFGEEPLTRATVRRIGLALGRKLFGGDRPVERRSFCSVAIPAPAARARRVDDRRPSGRGRAHRRPRNPADAGPRLVGSALRRGRGSGGLGQSQPRRRQRPEAHRCRRIQVVEPEAEARLEKRLAGRRPGEPRESSDALRPAGHRPAGATAGAADPEAVRRYLRWLVGEAGGRRALAGLRVALDAANGAAATIAGELFCRPRRRVSSSSSPLRTDRTSTATAARPIQRRSPPGSRPASSTSGSLSTETPTARCCSTNEGRFTTATRCSISGPATSTGEASWSCRRSSPPA